MSSAAVPGQGWLQQLSLAAVLAQSCAGLPHQGPAGCQQRPQSPARVGWQRSSSCRVGAPRQCRGLDGSAAPRGTGVSPAPGTALLCSSHGLCTLGLPPVLVWRGEHIQDPPAEPEPPARVQWPPLLHRLLVLLSSLNLPWAPCPSHAQPGLGDQAGNRSIGKPWCCPQALQATSPSTPQCWLHQDSPSRLPPQRKGIFPLQLA